MKRSRVLFLCIHNSARSQMAEGLLRQLGGIGLTERAQSPPNDHVPNATAETSTSVFPSRTYRMVFSPGDPIAASMARTQARTRRYRTKREVAEEH
jgi:hypothetical protein